MVVIPERPTRQSRLPGALGAAQLQPPESATTVRVEDGRTLTTDGPFANTKEVLGGVFLFEQPRGGSGRKYPTSNVALQWGTSWRFGR